MAHKIGTKDTWQSLALKYRVSTKEIALWNDLSINQQLKVGQTLTLFVNAKALPKKKAPSKVSPSKPSANAHPDSPSKKSSHKKS